MITSNSVAQQNIFLDIDDESEENKLNIASIDTAHQFLNFSRKVTEASSMRKPVDIQLGIAPGRDLLFRTPRLLPQHQLRSHPKPSNSLELSKKNNHTTVPIDTVVEKTLPLPTSKSPNDDTIIVKNDKKIMEAKHRSLPLRQQIHHHINMTDNYNKLSTDVSTTSSPLLDRLVADVLNHIESCPDHSAYSEDLGRLKPKLVAHSITHLPPPLTSS